MTPEAKNGFKVLLHLMDQAETESAKCDVLKNFVEGCLKSALAERTEQCAKICDDRIAFVDEKVGQLENLPVWDRDGYHVYTYAEACRFEAATLAQKIRALNQENKS